MKNTWVAKDGKLVRVIESLRHPFEKNKVYFEVEYCHGIFHYTRRTTGKFYQTTVYKYIFTIEFEPEESIEEIKSNVYVYFRLIHEATKTGDKSLLKLVDLKENLYPQEVSRDTPEELAALLDMDLGFLYSNMRSPY